MRHRLIVGHTGALCREAAHWLPPSVRAAMPQPQRLAGRVLLSRALNRPLPPLLIAESGKPCFAEPSLPAFSLSHSGQTVALLLSSGGEVGCDIEQVRARPRFAALAAQSFSPACCHWLRRQRDPLAAFWQLWTVHEAVLKQQGRSVWAMRDLHLSLPHLAPAGLVTHTFCLDGCRIALCARQPFTALKIERL
ncbi:hypothetical protein CYR55_10455 [Chimaeribacter californicus]|uniref:4'-phosphopantetheinyl transferase domain-containing protein n=1 Tax=Chimaeribacter californicus TaxID=2060067 RepID=A0A2N5E784_9GAMM|nr:4'-phosphopantetheinyl transferase superfamily protein [Chimaeribacter californicus]PLR37350.1 hypothetical protein CYR55_10455 [Chimaeribacter californicus]